MKTKQEIIENYNQNQMKKSELTKYIMLFYSIEMKPFAEEYIKYYMKNIEDISKISKTFISTLFNDSIMAYGHTYNINNKVYEIKSFETWYNELK